MANWSNPYYICKSCQDDISEPYETWKGNCKHQICKNCLALDSFEKVKRNLKTGEAVRI